MMFLKELMLIKQMNQSLYQSLLVHLDKGFRFQIYVNNDCDNLLIVSTNLDVIVILNINNVDHRCNINGISKRKS